MWSWRPLRLHLATMVIMSLRYSLMTQTFLIQIWEYLEQNFFRNFFLRLALRFFFSFVANSHLIPFGLFITTTKISKRYTCKFQLHHEKHKIRSREKSMMKKDRYIKERETDYWHETFWCWEMYFIPFEARPLIVCLCLLSLSSLS